MSDPDKTPHALHNEEACDFLLGSGNHHDWAVTTAFYSALHFVQSAIFPITKIHPQRGTLVIFSCFAKYYTIFSPSLKVNKHEATALLIDEYKPAIAAAYRQLMDMCMSARYNDYNVKPSEARFARKKLNKIKIECLGAPPSIAVSETETSV